MIVRDFSVLTFVILIIVMLVIPLPPFLLDLLIITNIALSLVVILVAMNMKEPLEFSIFPALLLLLTLFRLGLSVSTTRAILSDANAGHVIEAFGAFVVGGNALVGFVVFVILVIIQFVVIVKGAERVSEVGARFTLDAMPGKQMSIDADLNAGMITETQARERREKVEKEADFYGSMDGASKFIKGDAIAAIIIVIINLIVGMVVGMVQMGLSFGESAQTFTLLTVGDGLVTQIPALLVSTATGIVVTRAASDGNLSQDITKQLLAFPKMLYVAGATILLLSVLAPIPFQVTLPVAAILIVGAYLISRQKKELEAGEMAAVTDEETNEDDRTSPESVMSLLQIDPIEFEFGYGLIPLADTEQGGDLLDRVVMIRRQLAIELGLIVPVVRIRDNIQLQPNEYRLKVKGNEVARGELLLDHYLAMSPGYDDERVEGLDTIEPAFQMPAKWISDGMKETAELAGYTVVDPPSVVSTHMTEVIKRHAYELLGRQETKQLIEHLKETHEILVEDVTPEPLSVGSVQKVLAKLLKEQVSIKNLPLIFEALADYGRHTSDTDLLAEYARQQLAKQITLQFAGDARQLQVLTLSGSAEKTIAEAIKHTEQGSYLHLNPQDSQSLIESISSEANRLAEQDTSPVILCSPAVRMYVKDMIEKYLPTVPVLSYNELEPSIEIQSVGMVSMS
ncbi:flagellar biosynthesis protein FlhA [Aureibacillus halotolerans]|uniref:Flagellar biosynthesis protein FlhA n=1 Tax=Aureibacillus halotolerans TaxID=1508390 RepID=A0A4R6U9C0_9BACI|nr:flagellar biosynthesis protein FlhA [Aureibacillus halotolerans]TDQ39664.1 flagellar biosynthesis protein FlhA [Aureibacillus halotolerans]